jgi:Putative zinc-finger
MPDREHWHLSEEAVYDFVDGALGPAAIAEAERHLRSCPACARLLRRAESLFARLETTDLPRLDRDLAPSVIARLHAARASSVGWRWVLAAEAAAAVVAFAALSARLERWAEALLVHPAFVAMRQDGVRLVAEASAWLAPFLDFIPSYPSRLASMRLAIPHLEGPVQGWVGLAAVALLLGLVGNALLLRSSERVVAQTGRSAKGRAARSGGLGGASRGGRK